MKVFVAGATGAIGRVLVPQLVARGHEVIGMTRSAAKQDLVRSLCGRDRAEPCQTGQHPLLQSAHCAPPGVSLVVVVIWAGTALT